jgi:hypothetical protein
MKHFLNIYNSLHELSSALEGDSRSSLFQSRSYLASENTSDRTKKFTSTSDFKEADELMKYGDKKNAKKLNAALKINAPALGLMNKKKAFNSVWGFIPNVGAALAGDPLNMIMMKNIPAQKKVITIIFDKSVDHTIKTSEIVDASARLINAIIALENAGKRVNLFLLGGFANEYADNASEALLILTKIKDSGSLFEKEKLAYSLLNASYHRRHMFKCLEKQEGLFDSAFTEHYGYPPKKGLTEKILKEKRFNYDALFTFYDIRYKNDEDIKMMIEAKKSAAL